MPPPGPAKPIQLCLKSSGQKLAVTRGAALFYSDTLNHLPPIFPFVLKSMPAVHEIMIFLTIREVGFRESYFFEYFYRLRLPFAFGHPKPVLLCVVLLWAPFA